MTAPLTSGLPALRARPRLANLGAAALWGCLALSLPALALGQEPDPADAAPPAGVVGRVFIESVPAGSDNPGDASFYWRVPAVGLVHDGSQALPLDQLTVVLTGGASTIPAEQRVALRGYQPSPRALVVPPGTKLRFSNEDPHPYLLEIPGRDQPPVALAEAGQEGSAQEVSLDRAGRFVFMDPRFPSASLYVVVARVVASSNLSPEGASEARFDLGAVPPGRYRLDMYFRGDLLKGMSRDVEVDAQGALNPSRFLLKREDF